MTGRYQQRAALEWAIGLRDNETGLPASEISIARMLHENGYATGLFGKWHLGYRPEFGPNAHGFDEFFGHLGANVDFYSHRNIHGDPDLYENTTRVQATGYLTDLITERSVSFVQDHAHHPFFLCVTYNAPHWPFQPPDKPSDVRVPATWHTGSRHDYALMVERVDDGVGRILTELERRGLTRNTLVIFTNDNGGERLSRNTPFSNHKASLWEGGIRVPCLIRWPATLPSNQVSGQPVITMDLTATILAATGINPPRNRQLDGMDLLPIVKEERPPTERAFFWRINFGGFQQKAARQASWKYIVDGPERLELLFDLERDPGERQTLAYAHPEIVARFRHQLRQWETEMDRA
jgi:arylsulfatase A-like enzyme